MALIRMADQIRYDLLTQQALRGVVRSVLTDTAKKGLPGDHHFYISFDTKAAGVDMSDRLRAQYPDEMTIILQHQFWDLKVSEDEFEVGLSFGGVPERLTVPFDAINGFFDPSVQFGLQFEEVAEGEERSAPANAQEPVSKKKRSPSNPPPAPAADVPTTRTTAPASAPKREKPEKPAGGGEVVRLDRFRKK
ncbi:MAG TPA: ClpXP protease specificity-enhancing factor SspB [Pseudolabrys sp.]|nr:ClpXP protease specificity-enhancing factor SspB [Pseudolabrys sp.]